jgi:hypothetical protein
VIDFIVTDPGDHDWFFSAALIKPNIGRDTAGADPYTMTKGVEFDDGLDFDYSDGVNSGVWPAPPFIEYADPYATEGTLAGVVSRVVSLKVDFTPLGDRETVTVDIYAHVEPDTDTVEDPPVLLGYTQTADTSTDPDTPYGFDHADPGDLEDGSGNMNPACQTDEVQVAELSAVLAGSPTPNTICFRDDLGGEELGTGGANQANSQTVNALNGEHPQVFGSNFIYTPPEGYIDVINGNHFFDSVHQATWAYTLGNINMTPPEPYLSQGYDFWGYNFYRVYENTLYFTKRPIYDHPSHEVVTPVSSNCDIAFAFYEKGTHLIDDLLSDYPNTPCAMWVLTEGKQPTERVKVDSVTVTSDNRDGDISADNPKGWGYLGRLTVDRASRSIGWKAAE